MSARQAASQLGIADEIPRMYSVCLRGDLEGVQSNAFADSFNSSSLDFGELAVVVANLTFYFRADNHLTRLGARSVP